MRVAISGMIGCGKSSIVELFKKSGVTTYDESIDEEILSLFYKYKGNNDNYEKVELLSQFHFLSETIIREVKSELLDEGLVIYDRPLTDHVHIFAKSNLSDKNYVIYSGFQEIFLTLLNFNKYDITILLRASDETINSRINKRGREFEVEDRLSSYYSELNQKYNDDNYIEFLKSHSDKVIVIDTDQMTSSQVFEKINEYIKYEK